MNGITLSIVAVMLFAGYSHAGGPASMQEQTAQARRVLDDYAKGKLDQPPTGISSGWAMDVQGKEQTRSFLQWQAQRLIRIGRPAVPVLLERLDDKEKYIRYIRAYSLEKITGLSPTFYYFGEPRKPFNEEEDWFKKAHDTWKHWYEQQYD